jgi:hypothetical protein
LGAVLLVNCHQAFLDSVAGEVSMPTLKMKLAGFETSGTNYPVTRRQIPESSNNYKRFNNRGFLV